MDATIRSHRSSLLRARNFWNANNKSDNHSNETSHLNYRRGLCRQSWTGWAYILRYRKHSLEGSGGASDTTNNRMEITATIEGLRALKQPCEVLLISDSQYLLNGISSWRFTWRENGWMRKAKKGKVVPVLNADLWQELDALADKHTIRGQWVRGHSGHIDNERCDELAEAQAARYTDLPCWTDQISRTS